MKNCADVRYCGQLDSADDVADDGGFADCDAGGGSAGISGASASQISGDLDRHSASHYGPDDRLARTWRIGYARVIG